MSGFRSGIWFKPEVWPLFVALGAGCALPVLYGFRTLSQHNDIVINKKAPRQFETKDSPKIMPRETVIKYRKELEAGTERL
mmetsp:Transcript_145172/g.205487  ORF Transcript_145172/g.205487 Transcript_145172/m.205487 type:complete len:81 (+) Transcript_145172:141-383(+)